jgi:hypothetical protein
MGRLPPADLPRAGGVRQQPTEPASRFPPWPAADGAVVPLPGTHGVHGRLHYIGEFPDGDWSSSSGYLRFRVPRVRPGRYQLIVFFCPPWTCPKGHFVVGSWFWHGSKRIRETGLTIRTAR